MLSFVFFKGDETHDTDLDMTAGPSNADDTTEQVPQGKISFFFGNAIMGYKSRHQPKFVVNVSEWYKFLIVMSSKFFTWTSNDFFNVKFDLSGKF